jgi:CHASE2 domain-containing sensor protein
MFFEAVMFAAETARAAGPLERLKRKSFRYWLSAVFVFVLGVAGSQAVYEFLGLDKVRAAYFQFLLDHGPRSTKPRYVSLALINDKEYWTGAPAGRVPLNREYLARVVDSLVASSADVIALDFDVRLPNPDSMEIPETYKAETCKLIGAIKKGAAAGKKFVLATPISFDDHRQYRRDTDIYQANGLCERQDRHAPEQKPCGEDFKPEEKSNISCGYIALPYDILAIPGWLATTDGTELDSFALAIAKAERPAQVDNSLWRNIGEIRYSNFIPERGFTQARAIFSTDELLNGTNSMAFNNKAIIVGASWRRFALDRGPGIDLHPTPIGNLIGALVHANYAEALLDERTNRAVPEWVTKVIESLFSVASALILAVLPGIWQKLGGLLSLLATLFVIQWAALHGLAIFFDALFPVFCLFLHSLYERIIGMHEADEVQFEHDEGRSRAATF